MFVFEGLLNSSCFSRLKLHPNLLFTGHYTIIVAGTALSFDIGLGVLNLALSFFLENKLVETSYKFVEQSPGRTS